MAGETLLAVVQRLSPGFPVGGFAYSHGLEWAIAGGEISSAQTLSLWLADLLSEGTGRNDAILIAHAMRAGADTRDLCDLARALAPTRERLRESEDQGRAFCAVSAGIDGCDLGVPAYPVAVGIVCRELGADSRTVIALYLQNFAANLVQAAVRLVPIGGAEGQRVLAGLHPLIARLADEAVRAPLSALGSAAFRLDLGSAIHETMDVRICRT